MNYMYFLHLKSSLMSMPILHPFDSTADFRRDKINEIFIHHDLQ